MQLNELKIKNYKRLKDVSLSLEDDITLITGPNNSGKTSLIEILKLLFTSSKEKIEISELNIYLLENWLNTFYDNYKIILESKKNNFELIELLTTFLEKDIFTKINWLPEINIEISFDKEKDNICNIIKYSYDLEESNSVYFSYKCILNLIIVKKLLIDNNTKLVNRYNSLEMDDTHKEKAIKKILKDIIQNSIEERFFYTNCNYTENTEIPKKDFKDLFNIKIINALRKLDDFKSDSNNSLSKSMIEIVSKKEEFIKKIDMISDSIMQDLEKENIGDTIVYESLHKFNDSLKETSGSSNFAEINLFIDPETDAVNSLLKETAVVQYSIDNNLLGESSQGLGYSNMAYMHMFQQNFEENIESSKVNIMIVEEPESHMHPQMQHTFFKKILSYYRINEPQCIISTHSADIVSVTNDLRKIRVVRGSDIFTSNIYDLRKFVEIIKDKKYDTETWKLEFYDFFFNVSIPNIIFSNKVILYEGDSERLLLKHVIKDKYNNLYKDYVSYIQVGGAYAKNYFDIIKYLHIKTLVLTDIDYCKECKCKDDILKSFSSNPTINYSYHNLKLLFSDESSQVCEYNIIEDEENDKYSNVINIDNIYNWVKENNNEKENNLIRVYTQNEKDYFTRTLEEAMLAKYLKMNLSDEKNKSEWMKIRKDTNLKFSVPRLSKIGIRDIVNSSSNNKTDFMYSVILNRKHIEMVPCYIEDGLEWLSNGK